MTNNFTPKKSGTAARPQLSPEEYAAKKKAEKDAVYQMTTKPGEGAQPSSYSLKPAMK